MSGTLGICRAVNSIGSTNCPLCSRMLFTQTFIPCVMMPGGETAQGTFLVQPFGEQPHCVCQAWPQGSRNKLGSELALEVFLLVWRG